MTVQEQFTTTREVTTESVTEKINTARNELNTLKQNVSESAKIEEQKAQELIIQYNRYQILFLITKLHYILGLMPPTKKIPV